MLKQKFAALACLALLAASCNPLSTPVAYGVVKTVNGGADWQFFNTIQGTKSSGLGDLQISSMAFDPSRRETVYAGAYNGGLYKSDDSGANWELKLSKIQVYDFKISPVDPKVIYVAGQFADHGKLLYTSDAGATWQDVYNEETVSNPVQTLSLNPFSPNQILIGLKSGDLIKSSDGGLSWRVAQKYPSDSVVQISWQNDGLYVLLKNGGLMKSTDFAATFQTVSAALTPSTTGRFFTSESYPEFSRFFVDSTSPALIYLVSTSKLYKTTDGGKNWAQMNLPINKTEGAARTVALAKTSSNIVYASVGSTIYKSANGGETWQTQAIATTGVINYILIDPLLPQIAYAGISR